jgi:hypothetical protein
MSFFISTAPIQGFFRIDVHDRLFAEVHIGIINFQKYIFLIDVCYKGHIEYNLNLLKVIFIDLITEKYLHYNQFCYLHSIYDFIKIFLSYVGLCF